MRSTPNREIGPGKLVNPTFEHHHTEARSLTGGVVYYGDMLPELNGAYVYGDYSTGKIWAGRHNGTEVTWHKEIADTTLGIAGFANTHRGELLVLDYAGGIYRLEPNPRLTTPDTDPPFPRQLSETGLFSSVADHRVSPGVIPYNVISPGWTDGAHALRYIALPPEETITSNGAGTWTFPEGTVFAQTLVAGTSGSNDDSKGRRIETRILTKQQGEWWRLFL